MNRTSWIAMTGLCVLLATSAAQAHLITLDAASHASGTNVSDAFSGVTLSHVTFSEAGRESSAVYALGCTPGTRNCDALGTTTFGWQKASGKAQTYWNASSDLIGSCLQRNESYCYSQPQHLLEVSLDQATDFIQFASTNRTDSPWAWAFDAAGNLLSLTPERTIGQNGQSLILTSATGNISRILIAGNDGFSIVDNISYNGGIGNVTTVPEPETLALMMIGVVGALVATRKRARATK